MSLISTSIDSKESINHSLFMSQMISNLFMNERYSDGVVLVENETIPIIKSIISQYSTYFDEYFFENEKNMNQIILSKHIKVEPFKQIIKYCHSGEMLFSEMTNQMVYQLFSTSFQLEFNDLLNGITEYLETKLNMSTVVDMFSNIHQFKSSQLYSICINYININASSLLTKKTFLTLSGEVLLQILSSDQFCAPEIDIFKFVIKWIKQNPGEDVRNVLSKLRLHLISFKDLFNNVMKCKFFTEDVIMEAMYRKANKDFNVKYRAFISYDKNVLNPKYKPQLIKGEKRDTDLFSMFHPFDGERGFVYHNIGQENEYILIKLGMPSKVNQIKFLLIDINQIMFSYKVEISLDLNQWYKIADYSKFWCRLWQNISFNPYVIQYIRITGIRANNNYPLFGIINIECYMSSNRITYKELNGIPMIVPDNNVSTYANGAIVLRYTQNGFVFDKSSQLLSQDNNCAQFDQNKIDFPATHEITGKPLDCITIHLSQPYLIDRLKLKILSPQPEWLYSFVVHVSPDENNYVMVLDKREESVTDWHECRFQRRPISFIRITATQVINTCDRTFRLCHFECSGSPLK